MVLVSSTMMPLGTQAPNFSLKDVISGKNVSLKELPVQKGLVVMFICNHCPFVKHVQKVLVDVAKNYIPKGIHFIAINSNDVESFPEDSPAHMKKVAENLGFPFPYLYDETQDVARAYDAACTPDFFVFNQNLKCVYRGQFDDSRPSNAIPVTGKDLRQALDQMLAGQTVSGEQKPSIGCNIKWKEMGSTS